MPNEASTYFKYFSSSRIDDIFHQKKIRFTQPLSLNDPLEFNPILTGLIEESYHDFEIDGVTMPNLVSWTRWRLINTNLNTYGILSLSKNPLSFSMWSHYADGHKGFLVEFAEDFNAHPAFKGKSGTVYPVTKVEYRERFEININEVDDGKGFVDDDKFKNKLFYTKCDRWQAEMEHRLVRPLSDLKQKENNSDIYLGDLPIETIKSVAFGTLMHPSDKKRIITACRGKNIDLLQSVIFKDEIDEDGLSAKLGLIHLHTDKMINSAQSWGFREELVLEKKRIDCVDKRIKLTDISQLPYYQSHKEHVELFWKKRKEKQDEFLKMQD